MGLIEASVSEETLKAFEFFVVNLPTQIVQQVMLDSKGDADRGKDAFWRMFLKTSDYAKREWGWIKPVLDSVEVPKIKKKVEDPMMNPFLAPGGSSGGCDCGSCGGQ